MIIDLQKELSEISAYKALENATHFKSGRVKETLQVFVEGLDKIFNANISLTNIKNEAEDLYQSLLEHIDYLADIAMIDVRATYYRNVVNAIYRMFKNKIEERMFVYYKDKKNKILNNYSATIKDTYYELLNSEELLNLILKEYNLISSCHNRGSAILAINGLLKHCTTIKIQRI